MKHVFFLVAGGGFQWETLSLVNQLKDEWLITYIVPENSIYAGSALLEQINEAKYIAIPDLSSRANNRFDQSIKNTLRIYKMVSPLFREVRPSAVICLGSSLSFPVAIAARRFGVKVFFVESITRTDDLSFTGKILSKLRLADKIYVQWPEQESLGKRVVYRGTVL